MQTLLRSKFQVWWSRTNPNEGWFSFPFTCRKYPPRFCFSFALCFCHDPKFYVQLAHQYFHRSVNLIWYVWPHKSCTLGCCPCRWWHSGRRKQLLMEPRTHCGKPDTILTNTVINTNIIIIIIIITTIVDRFDRFIIATMNHRHCQNQHSFSSK